MNRRDALLGVRSIYSPIREIAPQVIQRALPYARKFLM